MWQHNLRMFRQVIEPSFKQMNSGGEALKQSHLEINGPGHRFIYRPEYLTGYDTYVA